MDGNFVPNISFGLPVLKSIRKCVVIPLDVHLMIDDPIRYVEQFSNAGANIITFHLEATDKVAETANAIRECGKKVGLSVKPNTPVEALLPYKGLFDMILIMSVEPGFGGQSFMQSSVDKIRKARQLFPEALIEVDGGINEKTAPLVIDAGVDIVVAGNAVMLASDRKQAIANLRNN